MSLPSPNTGSGMPTMDPKRLAAMDAPLIDLANQSGGDLRQLFYAFFSFLSRRTDFYLVPNEQDLEDGLPVDMGFREGDAEKLLLAAFRQFPLRRIPSRGRSAGGGRDLVGNEHPSAAAATASKQCSAATIQRAPDSLQSSGETAASVPSSGADTQAAAETPDASKAKEPSTSAVVEKVRFTEEGLQIPVGNGGTTTDYTWTQTLDETTVLVAVPEETKGRDLDVSIKPSAISVRMKQTAQGQDSPHTTLLEGDLVETIRTDESTWSLEGGVLVLTLDKLNKTWWETVLVGDDKVDTTLVDSRRRIDEYDGATQAAIRKILFDQRQERLGLPTSDEIAGKPSTKTPPLPKGVEYIDQAKLDERHRDAAS